MPPKSIPMQRLDAHGRMFVLALCVTDADLSDLGVALDPAHCCVTSATAARAAVARACAEDGELAERLSTLLDLRHFECLLWLRSREVSAVLPAVRAHARAACGAEVAGLAWALMTDTRPEFEIVAQRFMADVFVRGLQSVGRPVAHVPCDPPC